VNTIILRDQRKNYWKQHGKETCTIWSFF